MLTSLSGLQHVGFCEPRQSRAVLKKSHSRYTCPSLKVTLLVSFLITLSCHFCFNGLAKKAEKEKPVDEDLVDSAGLMEKLRKRRSTEGVQEPDVYDSVRGFAFFKHAFAKPGYCDHRENT